jgi:DNA-binding NarL/FixJ family response regulator
MKVLLVDDHPLILQALQTVIQTLGDDVTVVGVDSAADAHAALAADQGFDLVLLDLNLGGDDGFTVLAEMRRDYPDLPVVVVSATERSADVIRAIDMGAMGFVPKRSSNRDLFDALAMVMAGAVYIPPSMLGLFQPGAVESDTVPSVMRPEPAASPAPPPAGAGMAGLALTPRQTDVLALLLKGLPNKLIARELNVSVETVKDHVAAVLRALNVSSRTQAVLAVSRLTQGQGGFSTFRSSKS